MEDMNNTMVQSEVLTDISMVEETKGKDSATAEKKKKATPDLPVVPYKTCAEYKGYVESGKMDDNSTQKHNPVPVDALTLSALGKMNDGEILGIINTMSVAANKSDIRVMYANGYGFTWTQLTVVAEFKGYQIDNPGTNKPHYILPGVEEVQPVSVVEVEEGSDGTVFIEHGKRETKERKYSLSAETVQKLDSLLDGLALVEKSKATDVIFSLALDKYLSYKQIGAFHVAYRPAEMEILI